MNIAIILAVSKYKIPGNDLPASKKDGEIIHEILLGANKYDEILYLNENESSLEVKEKLSSFFTKCSTSHIEELFFYYSGHGEFSNGKFYYLLSDFEERKRHQTTLQNEEFDNFARSLNPELVVKVVDACQSGERYIKEFDILPKYFIETKEGFKNCYFLYSSLNTQSSYQDNNLSFFTKSFIDAIKQHPLDQISYINIIEFITDEFHHVGDQTPYFVIQAQMTEKFCYYNNELRGYLNDLALLGKISEDEQKGHSTLVDLVKKNAKNYVDKAGALKAIIFCKKEFDKLQLDKDIKQLYNPTISYSRDNDNFVGARIIGKWLHRNTNNFLAKPAYDFPGSSEEKDIIGYEFLFEEAPFNFLTIELQSKFPNLKSYQSNIALLVSKKELTFFHSIFTYKESGWDLEKLETVRGKWLYTTNLIADQSDIKDGIEVIFDEINKVITADIDTQLGLDLI
ncbi:caspase family protein [Flavobacterium sp. KBS0721]|uniref:caspase family protein n=1 Tax=Flavobacterium sp. KBS0721 TaxID=1179672 RepID=UPI00098FE846|nr:caspase family protein [Flavobacterium sp. KBS0721]QDW21160.1 caspase family protein [Flavobacterium sp. KBS0721]